MIRPRDVRLRRRLLFSRCGGQGRNQIALELAHFRVSFGLAEDPQQNGRRQAVISKCPGARGDHRELVHGEKHADCFRQVFLAFVGQVLLLGLFELVVFALEGRPAADGDNEGGVQSDGVVLQAVHGGFAGVFGPELYKEFISYAFHVRAVGQDLVVGGGGSCIRV